MRHHRYLPLVLIVAAAACGSATDVPTSPPQVQPRAAFGHPPPPPVDTGATISYGGALGTSDARFFLNRPGNIAWLDFESSSSILASPNARLMYNQKSGKTNGTGQLTFLADGSILDLTQVRIVAEEGSPPFGRCDEEPTGDRLCRFGFAAFTVTGGGGGFIRLGDASTEEHVP